MNMKHEIMEHVTIFRNVTRYAGFADAALLPDGQLLVVFSDAQRRQAYSLIIDGEAVDCQHLDPTSCAVLVRSTDGGRTWQKPVSVYETEESCGIMDPSIVRLSDGTLLVNFAQWRVVPPEERAGGPGRMTNFGRASSEGFRNSNNHFDFFRRMTNFGWASCEGPFVVRSRDDGRTWERKAIFAGVTESEFLLGTSDAVAELPDGMLLLPAYSNCGHAVVLRSADGGDSWGALTVIAHDPAGNILFEEPALLCLGDNRLLAMMRTDDRTLPESEKASSAAYLYQAVSEDSGLTWSAPVNTGIWGHPPHLLRLAEGPILCTYGYRRPPYGVRAVLSYDDSQTWDIDGKIVLRDDGFGWDLGYPGSVQLPDGTIFTAYYFQGPAGLGDPEVRYIAGTRWRLRE